MLPATPTPVERAAPSGGGWFACAGCYRVVTCLVHGSGPSDWGWYSRTHCCLPCERGQGHDPDPWMCAGTPSLYFREVALPSGLKAHCLVHVPKDAHGAPAALFLHGGVTYVYPETLWWDLRNLLEENAVVRERFVVVAPFACVGEPLARISEYRTKADRFGNVVKYVDDFDPDTTR